MVGFCKLLGVTTLCSYSCPVGQCSCKPPTRHMSFSVLQLFVCVWREESYSLKGQSLENGLPCIFRARGEFLWQKQ